VVPEVEEVEAAANTESNLVSSTTHLHETMIGTIHPKLEGETSQGSSASTREADTLPA